MTNTVQTLDSPASIAAAKTSLRRNAALAADHTARKAAKTRDILALIAGDDLTTIALRDPDRARLLHGKIALLQSEAAVDELIVGGLEAQLRETGAGVIRDTSDLTEAARKLARGNLHTVRERVVSQLRALKLFDEARLARISAESLPVRTEGLVCNRVDALGAGAPGACWDGQGGVYYENINAVSICTANDVATLALAEVTARAKELQRKP